VKPDPSNPQLEEMQAQNPGQDAAELRRDLYDLASARGLVGPGLPGVDALISDVLSGFVAENAEELAGYRAGLEEAELERIAFEHEQAGKAKVRA
jgi:hypothetical protein